MKKDEAPLFFDSPEDRQESKKLAEQERTREKSRRWRNRLGDVLDVASALLELLADFFR